MPVWVQVTHRIPIEENGKLVQKYPGDWAHVGKQFALQLIAENKALPISSEVIAVEEPEGSCGIMMFGGGTAPDIGVQCSDDGLWELRWHKTCFWQTDAPVNAAMFSLAFGLVNTWELAIPLWDYRFLAQDESATDEEKQYTQKVIRDLRVPMYDIRFMIMRRCDNTRRLLETWEGETGFTRLSFLRTLYRVKPLILALPVTWTGQFAPTHS